MKSAESICEFCKHYRPAEGCCIAFPDGIPQSIIRSNRHDTRIEGQKNNLVFAPIDYTLLKGEVLFNYFVNIHPDKEYSSVVALLPYAVPEDPAKAWGILERAVREGKRFVAVYPGVHDVNTSGMEFIGEIIDGALYLE